MLLLRGYFRAAALAITAISGVAGCAHRDQYWGNNVTVADVVDRAAFPQAAPHGLPVSQAISADRRNSDASRRGSFSPQESSEPPRDRFAASDASGQLRWDTSTELASFQAEMQAPSNAAEGAGKGNGMDETAPGRSAPPEAVERLPTPEPDQPLTGTVELTDVVDSIHATFPLLEAAYQENAMAAGKQLSAAGAFDTKLKGASENGPVGFYQTYRHNAGLSQPLYGGGELFGGYRIGRGEFQPWYLERQTNDGGEFKAGVNVPLLRDRSIDARRAKLWRATYDRQRAVPEIRAQLIQFVRDGSVAYWEWIAAGQKYRIGVQALGLANRRNAQLERKVDLGDIDPPVLQDNLRAIAQREAKLIDLRRKLEQSSIKLSLYYREADGSPLVLDESQLAGFPSPASAPVQQVGEDIAAAIASRPELAALDAMRRSVNVDLAEARNGLLPAVNAAVVGSQDVGGPSSEKRDKSPFELEAGIFVDVPLQRRKAQGEMQVANAKLMQLAAKRRFVEDKIGAEIQAAFAALTAAFERLDKARESKRLAELMAEIERRKFELGESDLLSVVLREQLAIEAAESEVDALLEYFSAQADYDAALARDRPQ